MVRWASSFGPVRTRVLVAESDPRLARLIAATLAAHIVSSEVEIAGSLDAAERRLLQTAFDAVVASADLSPDPFGAFQRLRPLVDGPLLILSFGTMDLATETMRLGADDVLPRPVSPTAVAERLQARFADRRARAAGTMAARPAAAE